MNENITISYSTLADSKAIFDLSNDDEVRRNSFCQRRIEWSEHQEWYKKKLVDEGCIFYVLRVNDTLGSYIRLDKDTRNDCWIITIHVNRLFRGKGLGYSFLTHVIECNNSKTIVAYVKKENLPSYNMFIKCGFRVKTQEYIENYEVYKLVLNEHNSNQ